MLCECFNKNRKVSVIKSQTVSIATPNNQLGDERHKLIIRKFEKFIFIIEVYFSFMDSIWNVNLADMQLISKYDNIFLSYVYQYIFHCVLLMF